MKISNQALAAHRKLRQNYRTRFLVGAIWVLGFGAISFAAWAKDWHWFAKFIGVAGIVSGLIGMSADVCAILDRSRIIHQIESANDKNA